MEGVVIAEITDHGRGLSIIDDRKEMTIRGFARLSAVYVGTDMLNKPECKIKQCFIDDDDGDVYRFSRT
ncbi:uncharacterized protein A4U43_C07F34680 [Asparagus officinalis]|uniref:Uncharacterized protein n=1 Tax=Asparagus officinalis TaxID=4686 RepID=A0A5P1EJ25_ASPOF|nr:uncharacterized protein A4U43_C07F34680 [Asparagus officinalis]